MTNHVLLEDFFLKANEGGSVIAFAILTSMNETSAIQRNTYISGLQDLHSDLVTLGGLDEALIVAMSRLVRNPAGFLGVVRLGFELDLQLCKKEPMLFDCSITLTL